MDVRELAERAARMPLERLEAEITTLAGHLAAAECRWLLFVGEFDRREGWKQWGCWCASQWLGWKCGLTRRSAQEKVRVGRALGDLPLITEAFARGELSYSQVRALTRVAEPATESGLLEIARNGTAAQLERLVRGMRWCMSRDDETKEANTRHRGRSLSFHYDDDGSLVGSFRIDPEDAPTLMNALEAVEKERSAERSASDDPETKDADNPRGARRADALVAMAESVLAHGLATRSGTDRYLTVVHVDADTLTDDADGTCRIEDGPRIAPETARRLTCDSSVVVAFDDDGRPVAATPKSSSIPRALRRTVQHRDQRCRFPSCHGCIAEIHHVQHRCRGGSNRLTNLVGLCRFHHHLVHEGGYTITLGEDSQVCFVRPDGTPIDSAPSTTIDPDDGGIEHRNREHGITIDTRTITSNWCGDPSTSASPPTTSCGPADARRGAGRCRTRENESVRRVSVVGSSGSGKTKVARALAGRLGVPVLELDAVVHQPGWTEMPTPEFREQVGAWVARDRWVVDGNYSSRVQDVVWSRADTVVWLDLPRPLVMTRLVRRTVGRVVLRRRLWNGNREPWSNLWSRDPQRSVIAWAWSNYAPSRERYASAMTDTRWADLRFVRLRSRAEIRRFLLARR
jgi:adenylate kinase family enzyme